MKRKKIDTIVDDLRSELRVRYREQDEWREKYLRDCEEGNVGMEAREVMIEALRRGNINGRQKALKMVLPLLRPGYNPESDRPQPGAG